MLDSRAAPRKEFTIQIKRDASVPWGFSGGAEDTDGGASLIMKLQTSGLLFTWNKDHPTKLVQQGDRIIAVNDVRGSGEAIEKALKEQTGMLTLTIKQTEANAKKQEEANAKNLKQNFATAAAAK